MYVRITRTQENNAKGLIHVNATISASCKVILLICD